MFVESVNGEGDAAGEEVNLMIFYCVEEDFDVGQSRVRDRLQQGKRRVMMLLRDAVRRVGDEVNDIKGEAKAEEHMTSCVVNGVDNGRFRNQKSNTFLMDLPPGGGVGLLLHTRNVAWAGSIQHGWVKILFSCFHERLTRGALHGLEVSSEKFVKTLLFELSKCRGRSGGERGG